MSLIHSSVNFSILMLVIDSHKKPGEGSPESEFSSNNFNSIERNLNWICRSPTPSHKLSILEP
jgi:hypothetical protein